MVKDCSRLVKMRVVNMGCIGPEGIEVALDQIVCLVGANNSGKSTVLRAYEAAVLGLPLGADDIHQSGRTGEAAVELWVHIPDGTANIDEKWKEVSGALRLVRSKWTWPGTGGKPTRETWDPSSQQYSGTANAAGLDTVFSSRLPKPLRIGSLQDPEDEHEALLGLVLEPLKDSLTKLKCDATSEFHAKLQAVRAEAERPVEQFRNDIAPIVQKVNTSYRRVFSSSEVVISVSLGELTIDPAASVARASRVEIKESNAQTSWTRQGTGSQRALFWSMLEVRSELKRVEDARRQKEREEAERNKRISSLLAKLPSAKGEATKEKYRKEIEELQAGMSAGAGPASEPAAALLPGYMLLIDEPETALHPSAIRAAKEHLYALADGIGWQVMLSTHHPAFVDPLQDHTTIVRLHRPEAHASPNVYRADEMQFSPLEKQNLKSLLAFDPTVAEMFFGPPVIIVEGDTEFACFSEVITGAPAEFPCDTRPLILRARGKATIPTLVKMLTHFKVDFALLHDIDAPRTCSGKKPNPAYGVNANIVERVADARGAGRSVIHLCSCPNFELHHGMTLPEKDKPYAAWRFVRTNDVARAKVRETLARLLGASAPEEQDGASFEQLLRHWVQTEQLTADPAYSFE
jgi:putative ATP-dependent endonuclease of the OLD family